MAQRRQLPLKNWRFGPVLLRPHMLHCPVELGCPLTDHAGLVGRDVVAGAMPSVLHPGHKLAPRDDEETQALERHAPTVYESHVCTALLSEKVGTIRTASQGLPKKLTGVA